MKPKLPDTIYHYTNTQGFEGILESQCLRATHFNFLNDNNEYKDAYYFLAKMYEAEPEGTDKKRALKRLGEIMKWVIGLEDTPEDESSDAYLISFCEKGDLLSQWRGYGATGYAIGFDTDKMCELLSKETDINSHGVTEFWRVIYDADEKNEQINKIANAILTAGTDPDDLSHDLIGAIVSTCGHCKDSGFREESEIRITTVIPRGVDPHKRKHKIVQFRQKGNLMVPYIEMFSDSKKLPITHIIVGPSANIEDNHRKKKYVELKLREMGISAKVTTSEIPYIGT